MGASAGAIAWMLIEWGRYGKPSVLRILTGVVAGLGIITPASDFVSPASAVVIGLIAGVACFYATQFIKRFCGSMTQSTCRRSTASAA